MDQIWTQVQKVQKSYGVAFGFADASPAASSVSDLAKRALGEDVDFGDEEEA